MKRSWFKSRTQSWRTLPEYRAAVLKAFEPYTRGDSVRCVFSGRYFLPEEITPCHIFSVGSSFELRLEVLNIVPASWLEHGKYEKKTAEGKQRAIEAKLPGRWSKLEELKRACYV